MNNEISLAARVSEKPQGEFFTMEKEVCSYDGMQNERYFKMALSNICDGHGYELPEGTKGDGITKSIGTARGRNTCQTISATLKCKDNFIPKPEPKETEKTENPKL